MFHVASPTHPARAGSGLRARRAGRPALALAATLLAGCALAPRGGALAPGSARGKLEAGDGVARTWVEHLPRGWDGKSRLPVVLALHGGLGSGAKMESASGLSALADREGFLAVYPDGIDAQWNAADDAGPARGGERADDVGFLRELLEQLSRRYPIDQSRVHVLGHSNGGFMALRLVEELPGRFAAVATVCAQLLEEGSGALERSDAPPPPLLAIAGTADLLVPYSGGELGGTLRGRVLAAEESCARWARARGCAALARIRDLPDVDPADGLTIAELVWCSDGSVVLLAIEGGGHAWPAGPDARAAAQGRTTGELDAADAAWKFFRSTWARAL
jgi:polyhydroxybutyrate depolymerase